MSARGQRVRPRRCLTLLASGVLVAGLGSPSAYADPPGEAGLAARPQVSKLHPDLARSAHFGQAVAVSGQTSVVGAPADDTPEANSGSATVYLRSGTDWTPQATLIAADHHTGDQLGYSVDLDGDTAVVGAPFDNPDGVVDAGAAYVFVRSGGTWTQQAKLSPNGASAGDSFGWAVALRGNVAVVTAPDADRGDRHGAAYVFLRSGTTWSQRAVVRPTDRPAGGFGLSVAMDQDTVVVGQYGPATFPGAAYVFVGSGSNWTQQARLTASDGRGQDFFGAAVDVSVDIVVVGAKFDTAGKPYSGSAYVFARTGASWTEQAKLLASDAHPDDELGTSVAVQGDTAVVGAYNYPVAPFASAGGAAYVFTSSGGAWAQRQRLLAPDENGNIHFGIAAALDGRTILVGAFWDGSGSAYVYAF